MTYFNSCINLDHTVRVGSACARRRKPSRKEMSGLHVRDATLPCLPSCPSQPCPFLGMFSSDPEQVTALAAGTSWRQPQISWLPKFSVCSVAVSCPTLCNPADCSSPGFPVHYLPEFAQTHVHWVGDAIQPSHPLSPLLLLPWIFPSIRVLSKDLS